MLLLALVAFGVPLALSLRDRVDAEVRSQASSQASILASTASDLLSDKAHLQALAAQGAANVRGRVIAVVIIRYLSHMKALIFVAGMSLMPTHATP